LNEDLGDFQRKIAIFDRQSTPDSPKSCHFQVGCDIHLELCVLDHGSWRVYNCDAAVTPINVSDGAGGPIFARGASLSMAMLPIALDSRQQIDTCSKTCI
jgi:hypothetical protein